MKIRCKWEVTRTAFGQPYRLHLGDDTQRRALQLTYIECCLEPSTSAEIRSKLGERTDCPKELLPALQMTLETELFLDRRGRMVDSDFLTVARGQRVMRYATDKGRAWLAEERDRMKERAA